MPKYLITQFIVTEYGYKVEAKDEDEARQKIFDGHEDVRCLEHGNPIAEHDCYSHDLEAIKEIVDLKFEGKNPAGKILSTIEEIMEWDHPLIRSYREIK